MATSDSVGRTGFYYIPLSPSIIADCRPDLEDIRIKDKATGKEVPYILRQKTPELLANDITDLPLLKANNPNKIVLRNILPGGVNELLLFIKNTEANRIATLSGSDDTSHWFVIKENFLLSKSDLADGKESFSQIVNFPYSNYRYFQIVIQGKDSLPVNIFKAGVYKKSVVINSHFDSIPQATIIQKDSSDKQSYIWLQWDNYYKIDKLNFSLSGSKFFNRPFVLYDDSNGYKSSLATGNTVSGNSITTANCAVKTNKLLLIISNGDNTSLLVNSVAAFQLPVSLIAYLDSGKHYQLFFGNSTLQAPAYDLQYFSDSIHSNIGVLSILDIKKIPVPVVKTTSKTGINQWLLWSIIIAVLLLLIYFSYAILKDLKQTNKDVHL